MLPLGAEHSIDTDRDEGAGHDRNRIQIHRLVKGIEEGKEQQAGDTATDRARGDFQANESATVGTSVPICKVALAVGASRHAE